MWNQLLFLAVFLLFAYYYQLNYLIHKVHRIVKIQWLPIF